MLSTIFLSCFSDNLLTALLLCLLPFLLGWLAAYAYHKVGTLRDSINSLTTDNTNLHAKVDSLHSEGTELRVKITQLEAELDNRAEQIRKLKNDLIICEAERHNLQIAAAGAKKASNPANITFAGVKYKWDDLKIVEGIGPKIAELCHAAGIKTWEALSTTAVDALRKILDDAGPAFQIHDPGTWPEQAGMAARGEWDALKKLQDELKGGK